MYGTRASPSSFSQSFYISPTLVCLPIIPNAECTLNVIFHRDRDRGSLYSVAHRAGYCLQQGARANLKLFLLLHSRLEYCLHRCVLYCIYRWEDKFLTFPSALSGLIAFRIWRTQKQTRDAKMGSNLMQVSVIVIESGVFHISLLATTHGNLTRE